MNTNEVIKSLPSGTPFITATERDGWIVEVDGVRHGRRVPYPARRIGELIRDPKTRALVNVKPGDTMFTGFETWAHAVACAERIEGRGRRLRWVKPVGRYMSMVAIPEGTIVPGVKFTKPGTPCSVTVRHAGGWHWGNCDGWVVGNDGPELGLCPRHATAAAKREAREAEWDERRQANQARDKAEKDLVEKIGTQFGIHVRTSGYGALTIHGEGLYGLLAALIAEVGPEVFQELVPIELRMDRKVNDG